MPVVEYLAPAPAVILSPAPVVEYISPVPVVFQTPAPVEGSFAPTPAVSRSPAPAPVVEHFSPAPAVFHAPTDLPAHAGADVRGGGLQGPAPGQGSTPPRGDDVPLPPGWRCVDMVDGRVYQWNVHTDQSQRQSGDEDEDDEEEEEGRRLRRDRWEKVSFSRWVPAHADVPLVP